MKKRGIPPAEGIRRRTVGLYGGFILFCAGLLVWTSGVSSRQEYAAAAQRQGSYTLEIGESHGVIYDRNLLPLNQQLEQVAAVSPSPQAQQALASLLTGQEEKRQADQLLKQGSPFLFSFSHPVNASSISCQEVALYQRPVLQSQPLAVHLLGYRNGEGKAMAGLEKSLDEYLQQHSGSLSATYQVNVYRDAFAGIVPQINNNNYLDPQGVVLTLDSRLQQAAEEAIASIDGPGAVVLLEANSGCIRALASSPIYRLDQLASALDDPDSPFLNRALLPYCLGSPFKLVIAAAALEAGEQLTANPLEEEEKEYESLTFSYTCTGSITVGDQTYSCHNKNGHGQLDLMSALEDSCNPYFIALGQKIGSEAILSMARKLGFGQPILLAQGLSGSSGQLPSESSLQSTGQLALFSFGQGALTVTPLQVAAMVATIANGGKGVTPYLISGYTDQTGQFLEESSPRVYGQQVLQPETASQLQQAMEQVVSQGSGSLAQVPGVRIGGKTGTAQTNQFDQDGRERLESWFAGYFDTPLTRYAAVVLFEGGGQGSITAAPVFAALAKQVAELEQDAFWSGYPQEYRQLYHAKEATIQ